MYVCIIIASTFDRDGLLDRHRLAAARVVRPLVVQAVSIHVDRDGVAGADQLQASGACRGLWSGVADACVRPKLVSATDLLRPSRRME